MVNKPKNIGTAAETAVVRYLRANGFPQAERRALTGSLDQGDVTGIPGVVIEVKGGQAAKTASDGQVAEWLTETETERRNAGADIGVLVLARSGIGPANAGRWWAVLPSCDVPLVLGATSSGAHRNFGAAVRMHLGFVALMLRHRGYGDPTDQEKAS